MGRFSEWQARLQTASTGADEPRGVRAALPAAPVLGGEEPAKPAAGESRRQEQALPLGLRIGMRVRTIRDVYWAAQNDLCAAGGTPGNVVAYCDEDHVMVEADRVFRDGYRVTYPVRLRADALERHPLEKVPLDSRTAPANHQDPDVDFPEEGDKKQEWDMPKRPQAKPPELGSGSLYEVVGEKAAHRAAPSVAAPIIGCKMRGRCVELFEWDETRLWRRCVDSASWISGWMMLDSPEFGPLLRPRGLPFQIKPHVPLCVAAYENNSDDVKAFLREGADPNVQDAGQRTPLGMAAAAGHLDMCVLMVMSGADAFDGFAQQSAREEEGQEQGPPGSAQLARALLAAFVGRVSDGLDGVRLALERLRPEMREAACSMLRESMHTDLRHLGWKRWHGEQADARADAGAGLAGLLALVPVADASEEVVEAAVPERGRPKKYEVVVKTCAIRAEPSQAARAIGARACKAVVELHDFDASGLWRRVPARFLGNRGDGWMLLNHETLGQLLQPLED